MDDSLSDLTNRQRNQSRNQPIFDQSITYPGAKP